MVRVASPRPTDETLAAAAIAAGGFLNLADLTQDPVRAGLYETFARRILDTLTEPEFLAIETPGWEGILKHGDIFSSGAGSSKVRRLDGGLYVGGDGGLPQSAYLFNP